MMQSGQNTPQQAIQLLANLERELDKAPRTLPSISADGLREAIKADLQQVLKETTTPSAQKFVEDIRTVLSDTPTKDIKPGLKMQTAVLHFTSKFKEVCSNSENRPLANYLMQLLPRMLEQAPWLLATNPLLLQDTHQQLLALTALKKIKEKINIYESISKINKKYSLLLFSELEDTSKLFTPGENAAQQELLNMNIYLPLGLKINLATITLCTLMDLCNAANPTVYEQMIQNRSRPRDGLDVPTGEDTANTIPPITPQSAPTSPARTRPKSPTGVEAGLTALKPSLPPKITQLLNQLEQNEQAMMTTILRPPALNPLNAFMLKAWQALITDTRTVLAANMDSQPNRLLRIH